MVTKAKEKNGALTIHSVTMKNLMRVRSVEQTFDKNKHLIVVGGKNAQGKTSFMDGLEAAFTTGKISDRPIHDGAKRGEETITLMDETGAVVYTITKIVRPSGTEVTVYDAEGHMIPDARALLDDLIDKGYGFDPAQFAKLCDTAPGRRQQFEIMCDLLGLDFSQHDAERQQVYDKRTVVNNLVKSLQAQLAATVQYADAPKEELSITDLNKQLQTANAHQLKIVTLREKFTTDTAALKTKRDTLTEKREQLRKLAEEVAKLEKEEAAAVTALAELQAQGKQLVAEAVDPKPLEAQLATIEETNKKVRENMKHHELTRELQEEQENAKLLTVKLEAMDTAKLQALAALPMPIPGLSLDFEGQTVLYNDRPLSVASTAEQIRVSVAMGIAMLKRLKVILIREGSHLDDENLRLIGEMGKAAGVQVFTEKVGSDGASFIMEDGEAVSLPEPEVFVLMPAPTLADRERAAEEETCSVCGLAWDACQCTANQQLPVTVGGEPDTVTVNDGPGF